jgi:putative tryptophan/tyrosine transport system substrate-binding protein
MAFRLGYVMGRAMWRREFLRGLSAVTAAICSRSVGAQQARLPIVGFLSLAAAESFADLVEFYRRGLDEAGFTEGQNVAIEYRWANGQYEALPSLATDLVKRDVDVIVASGGDRPTLAAKAATTTIPIVFVGSDDPVGLGLVESLSRPGGNLTGATLFTSELEVKKLELLTEVIPDAGVIAMLVNPNNPAAEADFLEVRASAAAKDRLIHVLEASNHNEIDEAFARLAELRPQGILIGHDPLFNSQRNQIVGHVAGLRTPAIYEHREFIRAGGLMSYGNDIRENYRLAGRYTGRILKGASPNDLPVQQASKFELLLNLKTAAALNLAFPPSILVRADEVVE